MSTRVVAIGMAAVALAVVLGLLASTDPVLAFAAVLVVSVMTLALLRPKLGLALLLVTGGLPLNFATGYQRSLLSGLGGTTVAGALLVILVPTLFFMLAGQRQLLPGVAALAVPASWALWSTATLVYTDWLDEGVRLVFKIWYVLLVGMLTYAVCRRPSGVPFVRRWWYVGYIVTSAAAVLDLVTGGLTQLRAGEIYAYAALSIPSPFSFYMLTTFVFAYSLWNLRRRRVDGLVAMTAALQVVASQTRISIGALVVALLLLSLLQTSGGWRKLRGVVLAAAVAGALLAALIAFPVAQSGVFYRPVTSLQGIFSASSEGNLNAMGREVLWTSILREFGTGDVLTGRGIGSSTRFFLEGDVAGTSGVAHNEYLRILYEQGLVGLAWFATALVVSVVVLAVRGKRTRRPERVFLSGACVAVIVYAILCITDNPLDYYQILGQYVAALAAMAMAQRHLTLDELQRHGGRVPDGEADSYAPLVERTQ